MIQRDLVWSREQILYFVDSLLRRYPVGTLLVWRTSSVIPARKFVAKYRHGLRFADLEVGPSDRAREYVLDGQQRLQALYIALYGSYDGQELHINLLGRPEQAGDLELRYALSFAAPGSGSASTVPFSRLVMTDSEPMELVRRITEGIRATQPLVGADEDRIANEVSRIQSVFTQLEPLTYFYADADESPVFANLDEMLEIFIRVNSGGTKLDVSDLIFSIVKSEWAEAQEEFEGFLVEINRGGEFAFDKDDLLRAAQLLLGRGAGYDLSKLRGAEGEHLVRDVAAAWSRVQRAIRQALDFVTERAQIRTQRVLRSKNALLPLVIWFDLHGAIGAPPDEGDLVAMQRWLYRVLLERQFGGQSVTVLNRCDEVLRRFGGRSFPERQLLNTLRLSRAVLDEAILDRGRGSPTESVLPIYVAYLTAGLASPGFAPRYSGDAPEVDHIIPKAWLRDMYAKSGVPINEAAINNPGNYRLIERDENRAKAATPPDLYYTGLDNVVFRQRHLIPEGAILGPGLTPATFEQFVQDRRALLFQRIKESLGTGASVADPELSYGAFGGEDPAEHDELWIEAGTLSGGSANQLELPREAFRFFNQNFDRYQTDQVAPVRDITVTADGVSYLCRLSWHGDNRMERINLPTRAKSGLEYVGTAIKFSRDGDAFRLTVAPWDSEQTNQWRSASRSVGLVFEFRIGQRRRQYGLIRRRH